MTEHNEPSKGATPQKLSALWFEDFAVVSEDGEIEDWPEVARKLIEHASACKIDEAQLESAAEEIERLRSQVEQMREQNDALMAENTALKRREEAALNIATDRTEEHIKFQKQRDEAIAALKRYGDHDARCSNDRRDKCSCGFAAAIKAAQERAP